MANPPLVTKKKPLVHPAPKKPVAHPAVHAAPAKHPATVQLQGMITRLKQQITDLGDPAKQGASFTDTYTQLYNASPEGGGMSLAQIDARLGGINKAMTMTEGDIRKEIAGSGGDVNESQAE